MPITSSSIMAVNNEQPLVGKSSADSCDGLMLKGWAVEALQNCCSSSKSCKPFSKDNKDVARTKGNSTTQSKYHGYWEKEELCFAFKHFQETDKYIEQYRQEKFKIQEQYYKDALIKVRRQNTVLEDLINQSSGVVENSVLSAAEKRETSTAKERNSSAKLRQSPSTQRKLITGSNPSSDNSQVNMARSFQGGMKPNGARLKTGLLWKRSISDPYLRTRLNAEEMHNQSNWTVIGVEKCPLNTSPGAMPRTNCHSAPPKNSLARYNSLRHCTSLRRTSKTFSGNRHPNSDRDKSKTLQINTIKHDLSAICEQEIAANSFSKHSSELNPSRFVHTPPSSDNSANRRPVITLNNLGDTLVTGVGVGCNELGISSSVKALPQRGYIKSNPPKVDKGQLRYVSSQSQYTDLFKNVINYYHDKTMEADSKLLSIKNF